MENNKKKNSPLVYFILTFIVAVFFELYWINIHPYDYFMLIGIGLVVLITGYLSFDGIIKMRNEAEELKREQNETMIKAQKAIYLATKKNAAEAENMQIQSLKAVNVLMDRMVETITEKQIEAKSSSGEPMDISGLINELSASNARLAKEVQNAITVNELVKANENLIKNVQSVLNGQPVDLTETVAAAKMTDVSKPSVAPEPVIAPEPIVVPEPIITPEPFTTPAPVEIPEAVPEETPVAEALDDTEDTINIDDMTLEELDEINPSPMYDFPEYDDTADLTTEDAMDNDIADAEAAVADVTQTIEAMEAASDLEADMMDTEADEIEEAMNETEDIETEASAADEIVETEEASDGADSTATASSINEKGPNDALTPEEIAALFANL